MGQKWVKKGSKKGQKSHFFDKKVKYLAAYCSEGAESGVIRRFDPGLGRFPTISEGVDKRRVDKIGVQLPTSVGGGQKSPPQGPLGAMWALGGLFFGI